MPDRPVPWFSTRRKPGPARVALDTALSEVKLSGAQLITAELARSAADLVDSARRAQDPRLWLTAAARLEQLLAKLWGDRDSGRGGVGAGEDGLPAGLAGALGAGPSMGDDEEP